ncbi:hypothetical protein Tco_0816566 [Tanacetum coccineum]
MISLKSSNIIIINNTSTLSPLQDSLNASSIRYALTVNPTIYTSCIKQFWATAKAKTINGEVQIQALVDRKKAIITETSVRRDLQLKVAKGTECLSNATIFEQLTLMGAKTIAWNEFSSTMASAIICLATNQKFNFSKYIFDNMVKNLKGGVKFLMYPSGSTEPITNEAANEEHVPTHSKDLLLSGEDKLQLKELLELCTKLSERVLDLENTKTSQAAELLINGENPLEDEGLGGQEDASKQDRKIDDLNADAEQELSMKRLNSKPKAVTTAATTTTTAVTRPKARGVVVQEPMVKEGKEKDEGSVTRAKESSSKRAGTELEQERIKKQKIDDDQEEAEMKKNMEIVVDEEEIAVDAIPLATKPPIIVDWKIIKEEKIGYFQLIRADGSLRRYPSMIKMLRNIDREDLETLWKLVKAKHGNTRPEDAYERVLWGDLKVMFEPNIESDVWRNLQGHKVTVWKLFSLSGVHFVRFQNLHILMLVKKKYPLTPATITAMLNKKL